MGYRSIINGELIIEGLDADTINAINASSPCYYADDPLCSIYTADDGTVRLAPKDSDWVKAYGFTEEVTYLITAVIAAGGQFIKGQLIREGEEDTDKESYTVEFNPATNTHEVIHEELACIWVVSDIATSADAGTDAGTGTDTADNDRRDPRIGTQRPY